MRRLYWKIVLSEGVFLVLLLGVAMWAMDVSHQADESRRMAEQRAGVELLRIGLKNGLADEVHPKSVEKIASRLFKSDVRIVELDETTSKPAPDAIRFSQGGKRYALIVADPAKSDDHKGFLSQARGKYAGILLALTMTFGLLAIPLARIVTRPLGQLRRDMRKFASGDLGHRTEVSSKDEVGEAAKAFNEMAESIQGLVRVGKEMTAHASHELRSPLTRIDVARQILEEQVGSEQLALLESMREEIEDMDMLIERMLRLSRLELNESKPVSMCFAETLREAVRRHGASCEARGVALVGDLPDSLPGRADPEDMACLVDNLLSNAIKFTPREGRVHVTLRREEDAVLLSVINDAKEPAVDPMRLLEPFQRGAASESVPGSGLGLSIAGKIVENHGGALSLSWADGRFAAEVRLPQ